MDCGYEIAPPGKLKAKEMSKELQELEEMAAKLLATARKPPPGRDRQINESGNLGLRPRRDRMAIPIILKILAGLAIVGLSFVGTLYVMDIYYPARIVN